MIDDDIACEGRIARDVAAAIPDGGALVVASSLPVRALEWCMAPRAGVRLFSNRGANGIDGFVSTVVGVASDHPRAGRRAVRRSLPAARHERAARREALARRSRSSSSTTTAAGSSRTCRSTTCRSSRPSSRRRSPSISSRWRERTASRPSASTSRPCRSSSRKGPTRPACWSSRSTAPPLGSNTHAAGTRLRRLSRRRSA